MAALPQDTQFCCSATTSFLVVMRMLQVAAYVVSAVVLLTSHVQAIPGFGMMPFADPFTMGMGLSYSERDTSYGEPLMLNCFASFQDEFGATTNELAVNIFPNNRYHSNHGGYDELYAGLGGMFAGMDGYYGGGPGGAVGTTGGLSARVELINNVASGTGFVVLTERARVEDGCLAENFGRVLTSTRTDDTRQGAMGHGGGGGYGVLGHGGGMAYGGGLGYGGMGYGGMGYGGMGHGGMGYGGMGYGGMGYGGKGYGGMGYGGMGYGGMGYAGMGAGFGMGFGMGLGTGSLYGDDHVDKGVITELNVSPGAISTAQIEDINFDDLSELAGRGVAVCSKVSFDWNWRIKCEEPYFSCCSLKYDNSRVNLVDLQPFP